MGFGLIGLGMGLPFMVLATVSSGAKGLPKSGGWLKTTKAVLGLLVLYFAFDYLFKGIGFMQHAHGRNSGRECHGIAGHSPGLINGSARSQLFHEIASSTECADRHTAANHFSEGAQIRFDVKLRLRPAHIDTPAGHHFVENQDGSVPIAKRS